MERAKSVIAVLKNSITQPEHGINEIKYWIAALDELVISVDNDFGFSAFDISSDSDLN